jgi:hypothetical protein
MLLKYKIGILLITICAFCFTAKAQLVHTIAGFVCTKGTSVRVAQVKVLNKRTSAFMITDDLGGFTIKAAIGDTIEFSKDQFTTAKTPVIALTDMVIFLTPVVMLNEVSIKGQTKQQELNSIMNDYRKKGVYYNGKPSALSAVSSPLNALYSVFSKDARDAKHFAAMSQKDEEAAQDNRKYNRALVKRITQLPDDEVGKFMDSYRPLHEDLMKWGDYEVINYIKTSLETYKKYGGMPLQKLTAPAGVQ